jgi:hypothetical protein
MTARWFSEYCFIDDWLWVEQGKQQISRLRCGMTNKERATAKTRTKATATADSSAALRNDKRMRANVLRFDLD